MSVSPGTRKESVGGFFKGAKHGPEKRMRQIEEYVTWINSHLKKSGAVPISDLMNLLDGVSLVSLVEVLGQCEVTGAEACPSTEESRTANLERVVRHLREQGVNLPESTLIDLKEFNTKGVLRMVLALAKHYNPHSIRTSHQLSSPYTPPPSYTPVPPSTPDANQPQDPPTATVDHAPFPEHLLTRPARSPWRDSPPVAMTTSTYRPNSTPLSMTTTPRTYVHLGRPTPLLAHAHQSGSGLDPGGTSVEPLSAGGSPVPSSSIPFSVVRGARDTPISGLTGVVSSAGLMRYTDSMISPPTGSSEDLSPLLPHQLQAGETPVDQLEGALGAVGSLKGHLMQLFALLRENPEGCSDEELPDLSQSVSELLSTSNHSHLTPLPEEVPELERVRDEASQLRSECSVLQSMVEGQEDMVRQLKSDILRLDYKSETEREELRNIVSEKQLVIDELDLRLGDMDKMLADQTDKMADTEAALEQLRRTEAEHLQLYEGKVSELQELKQTSIHRSSSRLLHPELVSTEAEVIRISLGSLRRECGPPQQGSLDHLEQSVARLMDHLSSFTKQPRRHEQPHRTKDEHRDRERKHKKNVPEDASKVYGTMKVMFFMENDPTPYRITVQLRSPNGPVLADFKRSLGKKGSFKYFFRSSEEGAVVKVELSDDAAELPMVDGKVMAWVYS